MNKSELFASFHTQDKLRYEEETRNNQQNDFFHLSLRNSRKLQALAKNPAVFQDNEVPGGIDNSAFVVDDDEPKAEPEVAAHEDKPKDEPAEQVLGACDEKPHHDVQSK